jgi:hypothetical protein
MFKKITLFASLMVFGFGFLACDESDDNLDEKKEVAVASFSGTLSVDQLDSTFYTTENVVVSVEPLVDSTKTGAYTRLRMVMHQVRFSPKMPLSLDMTVNNVSYVANSDGFALSGDSLMPYAMGGPFPSFVITNLQGVVTDGELTMSMKCGMYPLTYTGSFVAEP